ncbi:MAG: hypothetical protein ACD_20C00234G0033 [uncultured bacterium]|nr:MAG: hypothetical protein ACD_20C00234G0033 [uncultured bacterium]HBH18764.1 cysteine methyltransferase [Cyanobacteria bacterium UBA9579]
MKTIYYTEFKFKPFKTIRVASSEDKLVYIDLNENDLHNFVNKIGFSLKKDIYSNKEVVNQLKEYLSGDLKAFSVEAEFLTGTEFQKRVWAELGKIHYGQVISYKQLAEKINNPKAFRAVGTANSKNPLPIIFPCHRVINSDGSIGGFSGGVKIKEFLLNLELSNRD